MRPSPLDIREPLEPFDERDTVFARARLRSGMDAYESYYGAHPDRRETDERTRRLPNLATASTQRYAAEEAALVESLFDATDLVARTVDDERPLGSPDGLGAVSVKSHDGRHELPDDSPSGLRGFVSRAAEWLDAGDVGVTALEPAFVYSHRGRPVERFGEAIELGHTRAIVLVFPMRPGLVATSPEMSSTVETARVYQQAAAGCYALAQSLRRFGYAARAHVDANYLVVCPPLAVRAGLGELGRNGILIHHRFGPGVRLGVVTTDAPIAPDAPGCWGIAAFCRTCARCADACPAAAIPAGDTRWVNGAEKWPLDAERCYHYWRSQGTDCGVCIRSCPFAKPDTSLHRWVRRRIARSTRWNRHFLWWDGHLYHP